MEVSIGLLNLINLRVLSRYLSCSQLITGIIDLENFVRGNNGDPKKGMVLYTATVTERPYYEQFSRCANHSVVDVFAAYFMGNLQQELAQEREDNYYINHNAHTSHFTNGRRYRVS